MNGSACLAGSLSQRRSHKSLSGSQGPRCCGLSHTGLCRNKIPQMVDTSQFVFLPPSPPFLIWRILSVPLTVARGWQPYPLLVWMSLFCSVFFLVCVLKQEEKGLPLKMYGEIKRDFVSFLSLSHDLAMRPCGMWNRGSLRLQVWATAPKHDFCIMGSFSGILRIWRRQASGNRSPWGSSKPTLWVLAE